MTDENFFPGLDAVGKYLDVTEEELIEQSKEQSEAVGRQLSEDEEERIHPGDVHPGDAHPLLKITDLDVAFSSSTGMVPAVRGANLTVYPGQTVAIVGESGSGKSTTAAAVIGLLPGTGEVVGGKIEFDGKDITDLSTREWVELRGSGIGMVPQDPMTNLNPVWRVGTQVKEALVANNVVPQSEVGERVAAVLEEAGLPDAERRAKQYPHEFSGGMRQRVLIAIGMAADPKLLIADEPTSALDVTVQQRILDHLANLTKERGTAVLFITHDLGLAAERAEQLVVMHRGRVVESGPALDILQHPQHPYTKRLVAAAPSLASQRLQKAHEQGIEIGQDERHSHRAETATTGEPIIAVRNLVKEFNIRGAKGHASVLRAVDDVSFDVPTGSTVALVGESGSGKSTVANMILNLTDPTSGKVFFKGEDLSTLNRKALFEMRSNLQVVFQNPYGSLDPTYSIFRIIEEPLRIHHSGSRKDRLKKVTELLDRVALPRSAMRRYPNELSGGQRQRVAVARALALDPEVVVLDEAVSALDVLVQDQILHLLTELQTDLGLTYLFITHDLAVVRLIADEVIVMENGKIVEAASTDQLFDHPQEPYTRELLDAVPGRTIQMAL